MLRRRSSLLRLASALLLAAFATLAAGCASLPPQAFTGSAPTFDPIEFFTGRTVSWGVFETRAGEPSRRFSTVCEGRREGDGALLLDQTFTYEGGATQHRRWRIRRVDAHRFEATANDVVGHARGDAYGNAFRWEYTVALQPGNPLSNVRLRQWMYLQPDGQTMINRASIAKFGFQAAQVTEFFQREPVHRRRGR
jgi:hypothetical protein